MELVVLRAGVIAVVGIVITYFANQNRNTNTFKKIEGLPWAATVPITLMIICTIAISKTTWGRHLFATGGNAEAARRAGIDVRHIKVTAFTVNSAFAALGGIFLASNTGGAQLDLGAGNILLFAVAAAVIGGTSLFGGRGKPRDAILGALVIVIIPNGIGLKPNLGVQHQEVITGAVLLIAAAVDAISRRRAAADALIRQALVTESAVIRPAPARQDAMRRHNLALVLQQIHLDGALTRAELTQRLGLSRSTIGDLVAELSALGLLGESVPSGGPRVGRPSHVVGPRPDSPFVVAVDIDVTRVVAAAVGIGGRVLARQVLRDASRPRLAGTGQASRSPTRCPRCTRRWAAAPVRWESASAFRERWSG